MGAGGLANRWLNTRRDILYNILHGGFGFMRGQRLIWQCNVPRLFDFGVICYEIKNGRHILVWLAMWGGLLPGQLRYLLTTWWLFYRRAQIAASTDLMRWR